MFYNIYFSPTGGTKRVADIISSGLFGEYRNVDLCCEIEAIGFDANDVCLVSVPSYSGRVPEIAIKRIKKLKADGAKAVLNCVYGNREWEDTLTELQDTVVDCGFVCVGAVAAVAEHSIFRQFAAGRPDLDDEKELLEFVERIKKKLQDGVFEELVLEGNHRIYKEAAKGGAFKPQANELCLQCGLCSEGCPVGAIDKNDPRNTHREVCISCMRCVNICPVHARDFDKDFMKTMSEKMAPKLSGNKKNYLFIT